MGSPAEEHTRFARELVPEMKQLCPAMYLDEGPQHRVIISKDFFLSQFLTTQSQYTAVMGINPSAFSQGGDWDCLVAGLDTRDFPVEMVSQEDAETFCRRLSALPEEIALGHSYRLPTEADWEYACRANASIYSPYSFGQDFQPNEVNMDPTTLGSSSRPLPLKRPCPVGLYSPNAFGLYDMHSNISEWCSDWYDPNYYSKSPLMDLYFLGKPNGSTNGSRSSRDLVERTREA
jgi:formylglycine-generating enzyme required for sulfatase activity